MASVAQLGLCVCPLIRQSFLDRTRPSLSSALILFCAMDNTCEGRKQEGHFAFVIPHIHTHREIQTLYRSSMAWTCSAATNGALVSNLHREGLATSAMVVAALQQVDRRWFVPEALSDVAYDDRPLPIGYGATISAPHMHAMMLDLIAPVVSRWRESTSHARNSTTTARPMRILDVGSGSGFLTAALAVMCQDARSSGTWTVHGIEHIPELQQRAQRAFESHFADRGWFTPGCEHVKLVVGDGRDPAATPGLHAEYDVIHVGAAAAHVPPVYEQLLAPGGCLVIPVGPENGTQRLLVLSKRADGSVGQTENSLVRFVPLTSSTHQLRHV